MHTTIKHLKHWFIPHRHNDHRPHLVRLHGLAFTAAIILALQGSAHPQTQFSSVISKGPHVLAYATGSITVADLLALTNQQRAANGLPALTEDSRLDESASLKAQDMFKNDYWNHVSPACVQPWYWFTLAGYNYSYAGENLAKDFDTSQGVMDGWMNSPGHRANILNPNYTNVGFAVENGDLPTQPPDVTPSCTAPTPQNNAPTTLVVAHYGSLAHTPTPAPAPVKSSSPPAVVLPATSTPAPTPAPTPAQTATPSPTPAIHPPIIQGEITEATYAPPSSSYGLFKPLSLVKTLDWQTQATLGLLSLLLIVFLMTHFTVWRKGLPRWRSTRYKMYAAAQISGLILVITMLSISGFGKVG
jgi:uncharacterized protein YkwD